MSLYSRPLRDFQHVVNDTLRSLHDMGVRVHDVNIRHGRSEYAQEYIGHSPIPPHMNYTPNDAIWQLEVQNETVLNMVLADKRYNECEAERLRVMREREELVNTVRCAQEKTMRLARTLNDNPGIKEQWTEMMVMLKLAGFDENLLTT
jgi:hypothetical protein